MNIQHPAFTSVLLPLIIALLVTGILRMVGGSGRGARSAGAATGIALLATLVLLLGIPDWPPRGGMQKLPYIVCAGILLGLFFDLRSFQTRMLFPASVLWLAGIYLWLSWTQLDRSETWWLMGGLALATLVLLPRVTITPERGLRRAVMFLVAAVGLGVIAVVSGSLVIGQLSLALAAAIGGFALWNWPKARYPFAAAALFGSGLPLLALAALTLLLTDAPPWALVPLVLVFFSDLVSTRLPAGRGASRDVLQPIYLALVAAMPAALGIALAVFSGQADDLYYR